MYTGNSVKSMDQIARIQYINTLLSNCVIRHMDTQRGHTVQYFNEGRLKVKISF